MPPGDDIPHTDRGHDARAWLATHSTHALLAYLCVYALFGVLTIPFYPSYGFPYGDEGTYLSYARNPWTLISEFFEGYRPKEVMNPYNLRLFLGPFSLVFTLFGFTYVGARLVVLAYGLLLVTLAYGIGTRIAGRPYALLGAILLSLSPQFLFFTHGIRPEGMMGLAILCCLWLIVQRPDGPRAATYGLVAFISAATLMVHYNGVVMPLVFFVTVVVADWGRITRRKITAFALGGVAFVALLIPLNLLPAWTTLQEFGVLPVTFSSSNKIPVFHSLDISRIVLSSGNYYLGFFRGQFVTEPHTPLFTTALLVPALFGALYRPGRREACTVTLMSLLVAMLLLVFPNHRPEYVYYVYPLVFVLAACGLSKVPGQTLRVTLTTLIFAITASAYMYANTRQLTQSARLHPQNQQTGAALRGLIEKIGPAGTVTVMGAQEFHVFVPDVTYRTFHSLLATRDLSTTLQQIDPDIVIIHPRTLRAIGSYLKARRPGVPYGQYLGSIHRYVQGALEKQGFRQYAGKPITWDGDRVQFYYRVH